MRKADNENGKNGRSKSTTKMQNGGITKHKPKTQAATITNLTQHRTNSHTFWNKYHLDWVLNYKKC